PAAVAAPSLASAPRLGPATAPLTVVVFEDLECPFCAKARPLYARLVETYGGRVAVAFKQYPLPIHPRAELASVAALAAHRQGKFFELTERLLASQGALAREQLVAHAEAVGLDAARLAKDLDDPALRRAVKADTADGVRLGLSGTPTLLVGDQRLEGVSSWEALTAAVDAALAALAKGP
ncbi:thioredoxin domain-containing protein, partial [Myxococcota bacterium]|nr:thioredoxin domain-containing protein [Myxococcota bacterium]